MEFAPTPPATDKADRHKQRRSAKKAERRARKARVAAAAAAAEEAAATAAAAPAVATPATTTPPAAPPRSRKRQRASTPRDIRHTEKAPVAGVTPGVKLAFQTKADQGRRITDDDLVEDWVAGSGADDDSDGSDGSDRSAHWKRRRRHEQQQQEQEDVEMVPDHDVTAMSSDDEGDADAEADAEEGGGGAGGGAGAAGKCCWDKTRAKADTLTRHFPATQMNHPSRSRSVRPIVHASSVSRCAASCKSTPASPVMHSVVV